MSSDLDVLKRSVVTEMFINTADQNYLIARWAYHRALFIDFFWNSAHALEKYFKASLLLNGKSTIGLGHKLEELFDEVNAYAGTLFPQKLTKPHQFPQTHWHDETPAKFLARFAELGDAHNRYNVFGYVQRWEDLHHLDQVVYFARRVSVDLRAWPFLGTRETPGIAPNTYREFLEHHINYMPKHGRLEELLSNKGSDELRDAGLKLNFKFAPSDYDHDRGAFNILSSSKVSVIYQHIFDRTENMKASARDRESADLAEWMCHHITLPSEIKTKLQYCTKNLRGRMP